MSILKEPVRGVLMSEVDVFFQQKARHFTIGQMSLFEEVMEFPCTVGMGLREVTFTSSQEVNEAMRAYRSSLTRRGYSYTSAKTEYQNPLESGITYALVDFVHYDHRHSKIASLPASYFVEFSRTGAPIVQKVEFLEDPFPAQ